jgi:DNA polymerase-3 subunit delta
MAKRTGKTTSAVPAVCVICGKDGFLVGEQCEKLLDELLPVDERAMALYQVRAEDAVIADVLDELRTVPFLAKRRLVLIKDADPFVSANRELLERYFDQPSPCGVLVLTVSSWPKSTKLAKKLPDCGRLMDVGEIKTWDLPKFASDTAKSRFGKTLDRNAAVLVVELVGDDPGRISSEIDKLATYVADKPKITARDVEELVGHNRTFDAFGVIDAITAGRRLQAIERLRNMFAADKNAEYTVVGAFAYHLRTMFNARVMLDKGVGVDQIADQLRIWKSRREDFFRQLGRMSLDKIADIIREIARIDYLTKTGQTTSTVAVEQLVVSLTAGN